MKRDYEFIVIGDGIAAKLFLWHLLRVNGVSGGDVLQISSEVLAPQCTTRSTSVVCLNGVSSGVSPLGDLLIDSYYAFEDFISANNFKGISKGIQFTLTKDNSQESLLDFERRYGGLDDFKKLKQFAGQELPQIFSGQASGKIWHNYLIDPVEFSASLAKEFTHTHLKEFVNFVTEDNEVHLMSGQRFKASQVVYCTGAYSHNLLGEFIDKVDVLRTKVVPGSFLVFDDVDFGNLSFVISKKHANLVYRSENKSLLIGGTTVKSDVGALDVSGLKKQYETFSSLVCSKFSLPAFESGKIDFGLRHKGVKRTPYWGSVATNKWAMFGLYKNGYTFPFLGSKELVKEMVSTF